ncbi:MAG: SUMF1/EgtB/PvdO family nonheme iron enzyme [Mesorhizobium sp.]
MPAVCRSISVLIHAGQFTQGSPATEKERAEDETQRLVTLTHDFYIGRTEVTVKQFTRFVEETGYRTEAENGKSGGFGYDGQRLVQKPEFNWRNPGFIQTAEQPVTLVTFEDARSFTNWLTRKTGRVFGLPSEAEWEYAYRAGAKTRFYTGDADSSAASLGWFKQNAATGTAPVAQKQPNAFGLFDMGGNVYEWCRDFYGPYTPGASSDPEQSSAPAGDKPRRVLRGGSWLKDAKHLRAAARYRNDAGSRNADNGFRVVASLEVSAQPAANDATTASDAPGTKPTSDSTGGPKEGLLWVGAAGLASVLGIGGVLAWLVRRSRRPRPMRGAPPGVTFRPDRDGFWVNAPANLRGSMLHYRASVAGSARRAAVPIDGTDNQFVYTGGAPNDVEAEQIAQLGAAYMMSRAQQPSPQQQRSAYSHDSSDDDGPDSPPSFRGYPSAY